MAESLNLLADELTRLLNEVFESTALPDAVAISEPFVEMKPEELDEVQVRVFPSELIGELVDREVEEEDVGMAVAIARNVVTGADTRLLIDFLQEVKRFFTDGSRWNIDNGLDPPNHVCAELQFPVESSPLFDQNFLRQAQIFLGAVVFTYKCETIIRS